MLRCVEYEIIAAGYPPLTECRIDAIKFHWILQQHYSDLTFDLSFACHSLFRLPYFSVSMASIVPFGPTLNRRAR